MSSNINPNNINGNFPVAGQDNDSQGFRDNFTNILNNFSFAATEITDLQNSVTNIQNVVQSNGNVEAYYGNIAQSLRVGVNASVGGDLSVTGNITGSITAPTIYGNVVTKGGAVDQGYQYLGAPATNFWANISPSVSRIIIDPAANLAVGAVTLPNVSVDGTMISVHSTTVITSFTANTKAGAGNVSPSSAFVLSPNQSATYFWHNSENIWYKIS